MVRQHTDFVYENGEQGNRAKGQISPLKPCQSCQKRTIWHVWHGTIRPNGRKFLILQGMNGGDGGIYPNESGLSTLKSVPAWHTSRR